jgi:hypothetical protein
MAGSTRAYPELYAALGGAAAVPDLRGQFMRGVGGKSAAMGVKQTDATYVREGEAKQTLMGVKEVSMPAGPSYYNNGDSFNNYSRYGVLTVGYGQAYQNDDVTVVPYPSGTSMAFNIKISTPGVEETRPANVAVRYLIRALP